MQFLCNQKLQLIRQESAQNQAACWCDWMNRSAEHYEQQSWSKAVRFAGSSMELARISLSQCAPADQLRMLHCYCLAVIYTVNICAWARQQASIQPIIDEACALMHKLYQQNQAVMKSECAEYFIKLLLNDDEHQHYIGRFTRLPFTAISIDCKPYTKH